MTVQAQPGRRAGVRVRRAAARRVDRASKSAIHCNVKLSLNALSGSPTVRLSAVSKEGHKVQEFPGIERNQLFERLAEFERRSHFDEWRKSLFGEGPHLMSSAQMPWGDEVRNLGEHAFARFMRGETWMTGRGAFEMETEIVAWMSGLLSSPAQSGVITTGGSESNLGAVLAAMAKSGRRGGSIVFPAHTHYSIPKACGMFGLDPIVVQPVDGTLAQIDPDAVDAAIREDTIAVIATAGTMPFGTIDPIEAIAERCVAHDVYLHVDGCCGGFILPFIERSGYDPDLPLWDFRVEGVCSISADLHKHGMVPPPASLLVYRDPEIQAAARKLAPPFGTFTGTRSAGPIAGAWTTTMLLGTPGYETVATRCMQLRDDLADGLAALDGLVVQPGSRINMFLLSAPTQDLYPVWEGLRRRGWMLSNRAAPAPTSLLLWALPHNDGMIEPFLADFATELEAAVASGEDATRDVSSGPYGDIWREF
jgi:hypothetical protein